MITHLVYLTVIVALIAIQYFERRDLYNRIMSKSLTEYKGNGVHSFKSAHDRVLSRWREKGGENK